MCFGNITAAFGGVMYANSGLEATTINCAGVAAIDALTVNQGIACGTLVVNGGSESQIDFSTGDGATTPGASLVNDPYANHFLIRLNAIDRINVGPALITLNGSVLCGATTLSGVLNLTTTGLANHIQFNGSDRITLS